MKRIPPRGTTLLELAIVLAIIGILSVTALQYYTATRTQATRLKALEDMQNIKQAIQRFRRIDHQPRGMNYGMRRPTSAVELLRVRFPDAEESGSVHLMDSMPKTPWGLDYNIDLYHVIAWSTDEHAETHNGLHGRMLRVPYTDIHTESFEADAWSTDLWRLVVGGGATSVHADGALTLVSPHDLTKDDHIYLLLKKSFLLKGKGADGTVEVAASRVMDVEWGTVVQVNLEYYQEAASTPVTLVAGHALDVNPAAESRDQMGAVYFWPASGGLPLTALTDPLDALSSRPCGMRFSNRAWQILPLLSPDPIIDPDTKSVVGQGGWAPGYHELRFVSKYDTLQGAWLLDVFIDGDRKGTIANLSAVSDDNFYLMVGPDVFMNPAMDTRAEMIIHSISVSNVDFSRHYRTPLWKDAITWGR